MTHNTREEPFLDLTDYGQYQVRINVESRERGLELLEETKALHHQIQKARHDWLREEIVMLKEIQSNIDDFAYDSDERGKREILQTIIDRYYSELDQDNK